MKRIIWLTCILAIAIASPALGNTLNGFNLQNSLVPIAEIMRGGPPRDGIPAIDQPHYQPVSQTHYLQDDDRVLGLLHNGVARAYPTRVLVWHEIVNTRFNGDPVVVSYCPLCGTGLAFAASLDGTDLTFGVSGLLHNSDLLMYDRETESLWSQIPGKAISGEQSGKTLTRLPLTHTTWAEWRRQYPRSLILSKDTGYARDYDRTPYSGYETSERLYFPVSGQDARYSNKTWVIGLEQDGEARAWPFPELAKTSGTITDSFAGNKVVIHYDHATRTALAEDADGKPLPAVRAYWFAWYSFYPFTDVYAADK